MLRLNCAFDLFLKFCKDKYSIDTAQLFKDYPSEEWGTPSWSYHLFLDFMAGYMRYKRMNHFSFLKKKYFEYFIPIPQFDIFSYHSDFSHKMNLFKLLRSQDINKPILIPECGMVGFEIMIARVAGFEKIISYDANEEYVECCKKIWPTVSYSVSSTKNFDFHSIECTDALIVYPHWAHDKNIFSKLNPKNLLKTVPSNTSYRDIICFYKKLGDLN